MRTKYAKLFLDYHASHPWLRNRSTRWRIAGRLATYYIIRALDARHPTFSWLPEKRSFSKKKKEARKGVFCFSRILCHNHKIHLFRKKYPYDTSSIFPIFPEGRADREEGRASRGGIFEEKGLHDSRDELQEPKREAVGRNRYRNEKRQGYRLCGSENTTRRTGESLPGGQFDSRKTPQTRKNRRPLPPDTPGNRHSLPLRRRHHPLRHHRNRVDPPLRTYFRMKNFGNDQLDIPFNPHYTKLIQARNMEQIPRKIEGDNVEEARIKTEIQWSTEGPGEHNFIRIVTDSLSDDLKEFLRENNYQLIFFEDLNDPEKIEHLQKLFIEAQSYRDRIKNHKVAVIVNKKVRDQIGNNEKTMREWRTSTQYILSFEV